MVIGAQRPLVSKLIKPGFRGRGVECVSGRRSVEKP